MTRKDVFKFVNTRKAVVLQQKLSRLVKCVNNPDFKPRWLCGMDAAYEADNAFVAAAVWDTRDEKIVETAQALDQTTIDYIPGFFAFREGPLLVRITARLRARPDIFLVDGHGIAHPRGFGLACHVGLALEKPTIGVAKSLLYGRSCGDRVIDPEGTIRGRIVKTETGKRYYVSVGHRVALDTAFELVQNCIREESPAPLRRAHSDSILLKRSMSA